MSKRVYQHPTEPATGKKYWRSMGQLSSSPEFQGWLEREFPQGAAEFHGGDVSRRNFIQLMGASLGLAGLGFAGCRRPEKHLVPFTRGVEWSIPGKALFFASSMPSRRGAVPLVVATHDGRPTKIEGNPLYSATNGASDLHAQSSILDLYDPDRARFFVKSGKKADSAQFEAELDGLIQGAGDGAGLVFLLQQAESPTRKRLCGLIAQKFPKATWAVYEPLSARSGNRVFSGGLQPVPRFDVADIVLSLDCDFLGAEMVVEQARQFSARRKPSAGAKMNRLYSVENRFTVTGGMADHRLRIPASQVGAFAVAVARELGQRLNDASLSGVVADIQEGPVKFPADWIKWCVDDLVQNTGRSAVLVGARQPESVHALVALMNASLKSFGKTLVGRRVPSGPVSGVKPIEHVAKMLSTGSAKALVIIGGNPVYNAPADLNWAKVQKDFIEEKKGAVIHLSSYEDETSRLSTWSVPQAHYLESWADAYATDGGYLSVQPLILPLFDGWSELDLLAKFAGQPKPTGPELVQETFKQAAKPADFTVSWSKFIHDGFEASLAAKPLELVVSPEAKDFVKSGLKLANPAPGEFEVVLIADAKVDDGRFANNGWLQELPDPITKTTWDNVAQISPESARQLGVETGDLIEVTVADRKAEFPAYILPGHADGSISVPLGYGRDFSGRVGGSGVGFNAYPLMTTSQPYFVTGAKVRKTGREYALAVTQEHGSLEGRGPDLLREGTVADYEKNPEFAKTMGMDSHAHWKTVNGKKVEVINPSLYSHPPLTNEHQWGMTLDLSACTGCSACMVACQAENNIPIVGKEQVIWGREMHWIRTDRYFASEGNETADPEMVYQPMMCQHCENAPCETVCPVNATVHSDDGLNVMAYNRCIGTRYCANNCPFKVRRFNFFDYNQRKIENGGLYKWNLTAPKGTEDTIKMQKNPNVTVRMRGVMEKCTFCVQRIEEAKIAKKVEARDSNNTRVAADAFTSACAQACPSEAITFGDIKNPESQVSKLREGERGYRLLEYLNLNARVSYLARIRNPNMKMPGAEKIGGYSRDQHHSAVQDKSVHSGGSI